MMRPPYRHRSTTRRGNALILAVGLMIFITSLFFVVSSYQTQMLQAAQLKLAAKNASLSASSITQALRAATYYQYMLDMQTTGTAQNTTFPSASDYTAIVAETGQILGTATPLVNGASNALPQDSGGTLTFSITAQPAGSSGTSMTATTLGATSATATGTWLDGTPATVAILPFAISVTASSSFGGATAQYTATPIRNILMCEINAASLPVEAEADINLTAGTLIAGNMTISGNLGGSGTISGGNVAMGTLSTGSSITQAGNNLSRGFTSATSLNGAGFDMRGQYEVAEASENGVASNIVRQSSVQRVETLNRTILTSQLYREGLATSTTGLQYASQPFYQVPVNYRIFGTYTSGATPTFTPLSGSSPNTYNPANPPPSWVGQPGTSLVVTADAANPSITLLYLNLQGLIDTAMADPTNKADMKVFIGATTSSGTVPTTTGLYVVVTGVSSIKSSSTAVNPNASPNSLTIISPNPIVFQGNLPGATSVGGIPVHVMAPQTYFGLTHGSSVSFTGQIQGSTGIQNTASLLSADGIANTGGTISLQSDAINSQEAGTEGSGQSLFVALISQD